MLLHLAAILLARNEPRARGRLTDLARLGLHGDAKLDGVGATVNGKSAYVYYISPTQINVLTPPDAINGPVQVVVNNNGMTGAPFTAQAQALSPSFFVFNGGPYVAALHGNGSLIGPASLYPGSSTPAKPGETFMIYANGFGQTNVPFTSGSTTQSGTLSPLPAIQIGGVTANVTLAGLVAPGEFQFNVVIPASLGNGDQAITATYGGAVTQAGALIAVQKWRRRPESLFLAPVGTAENRRDRDHGKRETWHVLG